MVARNLLFFLLSSAFFAFFHTKASGEENKPPGELTADLDPLITLPMAFALTPDALEDLFPKGNWNKNPYFKWLTQDRSRAIFQKKDYDNLKVELTLAGGTVPIEEMIVDFEKGRYLGITASIYNRGDEESISNDEFNRRLKSIGAQLGTQLACRPFKKKPNPTQGLLTEGWIWISARGKAVLEHNEGADKGNPEYLRMRLSTRNAGGAYEAATQDRVAATVTLSDLPRHVKDDDAGNVYISGIPMVDQGAKGYCVVASAQRLFEYYGMPCDMHQLAQIAGSDPEEGTSALRTNEQLGKIDHFFKTRFECLAVRSNRGLVELLDDKYVGDPVPEKEFYKEVEDSVDDGIPLLWALEVGIYQEDPPLKIQTSGGHMRMIIGYNKRENKIIFSDSWGAGHEFKTMDFEDAYECTHGLFSMKPIVR